MQRVIRQLFIDHFEIEIDIGGKTPRILRGHDCATRALENTAIRVAANNDTLERINRSLPSGACWLSGAEEVARGGREKFDGYHEYAMHRLTRRLRLPCFKVDPRDPDAWPSRGRS